MPASSAAGMACPCALAGSVNTTASGCTVRSALSSTTGSRSLSIANTVTSFSDPISRRSAAPAFTIAAGLCPPSRITRRGYARRSRHDHLEGLALAAGHHAIACLDDGRLLAGDLADRIAEILLVIEVDVRDHGDPEVERVGRVQPAAQPDLTDQSVDAR